MIYFDNASTTFPKAEGLGEYIKNFVENSCFNINRGSYASSFSAEEIVFETRDLLAEFFNARSGKYITFTSGITHSLNVVIKGLVKKGDTVVSSSMEHNAVYRPLHSLSQNGVKVQYARCDKNGLIDLDDLESKLKHRPRLLVMLHASNVNGVIMPIREIGALCAKYGVLFVLDSAQTAGAVKIDMEKDNIDALCFTGHKSLLGLQGVGGIAFNQKTAEQTMPFVHGGTGSFSDLADMPSLLPDRFEAGTLNLAGIASLNHSVNYINKVGMQNIFEKEKSLRLRFEEGVKKLDCARLVGGGAPNRCAVSALDFVSTDNGDAAYRLDGQYGIMVRSGLHCAPLAHKTLGSYPQGVVRFSFGYDNTAEQVDKALAALAEF